MGKISIRIGQHYGELEVTDYAFVKNKRTYWKCKCSCGNETVVCGSNLTTGHTKSCGCLQQKNREEIHITHGMRKTRLYREWVNMKARTTYDCADKSGRYLKRGISLCKEWRDTPNNFFEWAVNNGYQDNLTIDRIDNDKGYSPDNCRWITPEKQQRNKSTNLMITYKGIKKCLADWVDELNLNYHKVYQRIRKGWDIERAFTTP